MRFRPQEIDFIAEDGVLTGFSLKKGCCYNGYIIIPDGVREIGCGLFRRHGEFRAVRLPEGLCRIGESAFECASSFSSIRIPDSVTEIAEHAFGYSCGINTIYGSYHTAAGHYAGNHGIQSIEKHAIGYGRSANPMSGGRSKKIFSGFPEYNYQRNVCYQDNAEPEMISKVLY